MNRTEWLRHQPMASNPLPYSLSWRPSPEQELLLRAALWQGNAAREAWQALRERGNVPPLDAGTARLLPLLYLNLTRLGVDDPQVGSWRALYRYHQNRNRVLRRRAADALRALAAVEIPTLVLKALGLIPLYYRDPGARPAGDIDILVPEDAGWRALEVLGEQGWQPTRKPLSAFTPAYLKRHYAHTLKNRQGDELDLHRHVFSIETRADGDADFWNAAVGVNIDGVATKTLAPTDQLLHTCVHGIPWNPVSPVRWAADGYMLLQNATIDWQRLLAQAAQRELVTALRYTLGYLQKGLNAPVPAEVLDALDRMPISRLDRVQYELFVLEKSQHRTVEKLWYHYQQYRRLATVYRAEGWLWRFPAFLRDTWELRQTRQVPLYMARYTLRRLRRHSDSRYRLEDAK